MINKNNLLALEFLCLLFFLLNIIKIDKIYEDNESRNIFKSLIISIFIVIFTLNYLPLIINQSIVLIKELNNYLIIKY